MKYVKLTCACKQAEEEMREVTERPGGSGQNEKLYI